MKRRGFTLIEVLIATAIFAVISVVTFQGLQTSMNVRERVEARAQDLVEIQLVWTVLFQDFMNMARRPIREAGRNERYPAFGLNLEDDVDCILSFTRAGLPQSASLPAGMQRIAYCIREDGLYRAVWLVLDRAYDSEPQESLLMEDIEDFIVETYPDDFDSEDNSKSAGGPLEDLPVGVKVTIEAEDQTFVRLFPGGEEYRLDIDD